MSLFLGIDTSNYTTSTALYDSETGEMLQRKQLLPVRATRCSTIPRSCTVCFRSW